MHRPTIRRLAPFALLLGMAAPGLGQVPDELRTVAERSDFKATARHSEVVALCEALAKSSPLIRLSELGKSGEGRSLPLMIVADPPVSTPEEARASGKLVVFLFGNIHAGEVCGKEALPILVREIASDPHPPLLKNLILAVAPIYNADGNERVSKTNRPGQVGPEEGMGQRANAAGLDLNRDFMKLDAPETRALVRFLDEWDPHLTIDTHTTNGSHHRYLITCEGPKNPAGDRQLIDYSRVSFLVEIGLAFERATGSRAFFYGNFEGDHSRWTSFPATPRFGTTYIGVRNRFSILTEAYSYAPYRDRVIGTKDYCLAALRVADLRRDLIRKLLDDARRKTIEAGATPNPSDKVAIRSKARAFPGKATVLGFVEREENGRMVATAEPKDYRCAIEQDFAPEYEVPRPFAYLIPTKFQKAVEALRSHGIKLETLAEDREFDLGVETIDAFTRSRRASEGHQTVDVAASTTKSVRRTVEAGTVVVRTAQPLGSLAVYLLEPRSDDGLVTWNYFDDALSPIPGFEFPVARIMKPAEIPSRSK